MISIEREDLLKPRCSGEDGMVLVMVLIFVSVIGVLSLGLLASEKVTMIQTAIDRKVDSRSTGTNGGIDWAVQTIKSGTASFCQGSGPWQQDLLIGVGGRKVRVFCKMVSGAASGPGGIALYATAGGNIDIGGPNGGVVNGPVYNAGTYTLGTLTVNGEISEPGLCPAGLTSVGPPGLTGPYMNSALRAIISKCDIELSRVTPPIPEPSAPGAAPAVQKVVDTTGQDCAIFSPGSYTAPPVLLANNYFRPGVYYFDWPSSTTTWNISSSVWAGDPEPSGLSNSHVDTKLSTIRRCLSADPAVTNPVPLVPPFGVRFVFGQKARFSVRNQGRLEMFSYKSGTGVLPGVRAGVASDAWGTPSTLDITSPCSTSCLFSVGNGAKAELAIHGGVFAPNSYISMRGTNSSMAKIGGTTVINKISTFAPVSFLDNAFVDVSAGTGSRTWTLLARSETTTELPLCTSASLQVFNNKARTTYVTAWRVDRELSPLDPADCTIP